jgi:hypothetical protein
MSPRDTESAPSTRSRASSGGDSPTKRTARRRDGAPSATVMTMTFRVASSVSRSVTTTRALA